MSFENLTLAMRTAKDCGPGLKFQKHDILHTRQSADETSRHQQIRRVGYVRIFDFNTRTVPEATAVLEHLHSNAGGKMDLYILDLRGNMGGLLTAGIRLVDHLLPHGRVITTLEGSDGHVVTHLSRRWTSIIPKDRPLAVVMDGLTASSSELTAAALSDNRRATLVGTPSFGKGSIQAIVRLSDDSGLQLTIGKFRSLFDSIVTGCGITPDVYLRGLAADEDCVWAIDDALSRSTSPSPNCAAKSAIGGREVRGGSTMTHDEHRMFL